MENKKTNVPVGVGGILIITVFISLCLMIFAVLSFATAYSDLKLSMRAQAMTEDYYGIQGKAEEKLSEISDVLFEINSNKTSEEITDKLIGVDGISFIDKETAIQYEVKGDENQKISVILNIFHDSAGYCYEIESWKLSIIDMPDYEDEIIDVWKGTK